MNATTKTLTATIEGDFLVIRVPMNPTPVRSSTGKSRTVASSHGNKETQLEIENQPVVVGVTAYIRG